MEAMAKVIKVSNQMMAQIANTTWNLDACRLIIIKGNMTWKLKKCNKTIIHQQTIKAINNDLWCFIWQIQSQEMYQISIMYGMWILKLQITWLDMENSLKT
jgi:hypothetical protein